MNPLESRKQLLIAESELNRVKMIQEWQAMAEGVRTFGARVKSVGSIASATALLVAGVAAFRRGKSVDAAAEKPSWFKTALKGAQLASSVWLALRARRR
jgi:negative regulator of sigma E activity